ncbi:MAG: sulfotransferase [bacterium]
MTVVYIAGLSHSGSTLTARLLNEHSQMASPGELINLHTVFDEFDGERGHFHECLCESISPWDCSFWGDGLLTSIQDISEEVWKICRPDLHPPKSWVKAIFGQYPTNNGLSFADMNRKLFDLLREKTGKPILVDSSKFPWRALPLFRQMGDEFKVLHLIKSPKNQIGSRVKKRNMSSFFHSAILKYWRRNFVYQYFFDEGNRYKKVRFEELAKDFEPTLKSIHNWLGLDYENPLEGPDSPWHHLGGSDVDLVKPDPERIEKNVDFTMFQSLVLKALGRLY